MTSICSHLSRIVVHIHIFPCTVFVEHSTDCWSRFRCAKSLLCSIACLWASVTIIFVLSLINNYQARAWNIRCSKLVFFNSLVIYILFSFFIFGFLLRFVIFLMLCNNMCYGSCHIHCSYSCYGASSVEYKMSSLFLYLLCSEWALLVVLRFFLT